jgi:hypothetical protein
VQDDATFEKVCYQMTNLLVAPALVEWGLYLRLLFCHAANVPLEEKIWALPITTFAVYKWAFSFGLSVIDWQSDFVGDY